MLGGFLMHPYLWLWRNIEFEIFEYNCISHQNEMLWLSQTTLRQALSTLNAGFDVVWTQKAITLPDLPYFFRCSLDVVKFGLPLGSKLFSELDNKSTFFKIIHSC